MGAKLLLAGPFNVAVSHHLAQPHSNQQHSYNDTYGQFCKQHVTCVSEVKMTVLKY